MNRLSRKLSNGIAASFATLAIAACSSGDGVQIGTGQDPDPVVVDFPIAYVKSPLPVDDNGIFEQQDVREQITFDFGADLYFRERAASELSATSRSTTTAADSFLPCGRRSTRMSTRMTR